MENHIYLINITVTFDLDLDLGSQNNARNEYLRSHFYEKIVLRMNIALLLKSYDLPSTGVAMLDFDQLQEFPNISSWATKSDFICDLMGTHNQNKKPCTFHDCMSLWKLDYKGTLLCNQVATGCSTSKEGNIGP